MQLLNVDLRYFLILQVQKPKFDLYGGGWAQNYKKNLTA